MSEQYAVLVRPGGCWEVIRREKDCFNNFFWEAIAEAVDEFRAREIANGLNRECGNGC